MIFLSNIGARFLLFNILNIYILLIEIQILSPNESFLIQNMNLQNVSILLLMRIPYQFCMIFFHHIFES